MTVGGGPDGPVTEVNGVVGDVERVVGGAVVVVECCTSRRETLTGAEPQEAAVRANRAPRRTKMVLTDCRGCTGVNLRAVAAGAPLTGGTVGQSGHNTGTGEPRCTTRVKMVTIFVREWEVCHRDGRKVSSRSGDLPPGACCRM
jgi:hypothetical protein